MTIWWLGLLLIVGIAVAVIVIFATNNDTSNNKNRTKILKSLYGECSSNFDCNLGFHCELRDQPSKGVCVIPPGGACHNAANNLKDVACYSGYYCDTQEGVCLKNN